MCMLRITLMLLNVATATIFPPEVISACSGSDLELTCNVTESPILGWRIVASQVYRCDI